MAWASFTATFAIAHGVTWIIRVRGGQTGNVNAGSVHLHHYLWGLLLLIAVALFGLVDRSPKARTWMGAGLGIGLALIVDEAALLITLRDVYWTREGIVSLQLSFGLTAVMAVTLLGLRMLRRGERLGAEEGLIPSLEADLDAQAAAGSLA